MNGRGRRGGRRERKILRLGMWFFKVLGRCWKRLNEGFYLFVFLKGRKERGFGSEGVLLVMVIEGLFRLDI